MQTGNKQAKLVTKEKVMRNTSQESGEKSREVRFLEIAEAKLSSI